MKKRLGLHRWWKTPSCNWFTALLCNFPLRICCIPDPTTHQCQQEEGVATPRCIGNATTVMGTGGLTVLASPGAESQSQNSPQTQCHHHTEPGQGCS